MARIPFMVTSLVVVLLCFLDIHAVVIAQRVDYSSCTPSALTSLASLNLNLIYLHSLNKHQLPTTKATHTPPCLLANRLLDSPRSRAERHDPELHHRPRLPFRRPLPRAQFPARMCCRRTRRSPATPCVHVCRNVSASGCTARSPKEDVAAPTKYYSSNGGRPTTDAWGPASAGSHCPICPRRAPAGH